MPHSDDQESFLSIDPLLNTSELSTDIAASNVATGSNSMSSSSSSSSSNSNSKIQNLLSSAGNQYYMKPGVVNSNSSKIGDYTGHRPIMQGNSNNSATFKITQVGPVIGSNVIVSRMDSNNVVPRPTSASPINNCNNNNNYYFNPAASSVQTSNPNVSANSSNNRPTAVNSRIPGNSGGNNFYQTAANNVTKFTNMTVANAGSKNPLKPTHYTVPIPNNVNNSVNTATGVNTHNHISNTTTTTSTTTATNANIVNLSTHPNANLTAPNTSGIAPKTTLKASDLIHILPNLFNTLKRRNSNSGASTSNSGYNRNGTSNSSSGGYFNGGNGTSATNSLAAAVAAAASNAGKPLTTSTAAALVAEQLLSVAASGPFSDDSSPSPPPQQSLSKKIKMSSSSALQCQICGKVYKHRNCLSKHMWEHHESWEHTKKVCQTKHQQVQLLEAAQVLSEIVSGVRGSRKSGYASGGSDIEDDAVDDDDDGEIITEEMNGMEIEEDENISIGGNEIPEQSQEA